MTKDSEMRRVVEVRALSPKPKNMEWNATDEELKAIAERLNVLEVKDLSVKLAVEKRNLIKVSGTFTAHVVQKCVVTMEPVEEEIIGNFEDFFGEHKRHAVPVDIDMEAQDVETVENGRIDVGELVLQYLVLDLNPYPRKPGLEEVQMLEEEKENPFAVLAKLKKQ
jgi:uncharacterized metal-binding protein YceD (DUF177 family)